MTPDCASMAMWPVWLQIFEFFSLDLYPKTLGPLNATFAAKSMPSGTFQGIFFDTREPLRLNVFKLFKCSIPSKHLTCSSGSMLCDLKLKGGVVALDTHNSLLHFHVAITAIGCILRKETDFCWLQGDERRRRPTILFL